MQMAVYSARPFERPFFVDAARTLGPDVELVFLEAGLDPRTAALAKGMAAVCLFVNDKADAPALEALAAGGTRLVALRSAGFNHVDLAAAARLGVTVARVPAYSPHAVAEHAVALLMALNRRLHRALPRVRDHNFTLDGLMGFDLFGTTVGVIGTGKIGAAFCRIMLGFGCRVVAHDIRPDAELAAAGVRYAGLDELWRDADVVACHCPLTPQTHHLIDAKAVAAMKPGVVIVNTSRGAVVDTRAVIEGLKTGRVGGLALDVYEEEGDIFFRDLSDRVLTDDTLARLLTFPNVVMTAHQAFLTREAMRAIAATTLDNAARFAAGGAGAVRAENVVSQRLVAG